MASTHGGDGHEESMPWDSQESEGARKGHKSKTQIEVLEAAYRECKAPDKAAIVSIAGIAELEPVQVKRWFSNKRHRERRTHGAGAGAGDENERRTVEDDMQWSSTLQSDPQAHAAGTAAEYAQAAVSPNSSTDSSTSPPPQPPAEVEPQPAADARESITTLSIFDQHRVANDLWQFLKQAFGSTEASARPTSSKPTKLFQTAIPSANTRHEPEVLYTPIFPSLCNADAAIAVRRYRDETDVGHLDEAMLLGLQRVFEQHMDYFLHLAPKFVTDGGRSGLLGPLPVPFRPPRVPTTSAGISGYVPLSAGHLHREIATAVPPPASVPLSAGHVHREIATVGPASIRPADAPFVRLPASRPPEAPQASWLGYGIPRTINDVRRPDQYHYERGRPVAGIGPVRGVQQVTSSADVHYSQMPTRGPSRGHHQPANRGVHSTPSGVRRPDVADGAAYYLHPSDF